MLYVKEAQDLLRFGRTKIYRMMAAGHLRSVKEGRSIRITRASVEAYVQTMAA